MTSPISEKPQQIVINGTERWWLNGNLHREDGPALTHASGTKMWYLNGELHRIDGPAVIFFTGGKEWWIQGNCYLREQGSV
jgi:hypothetical protein